MLYLHQIIVIQSEKWIILDLQVSPSGHVGSIIFSPVYVINFGPCSRISIDI